MTSFSENLCPIWNISFWLQNILQLYLKKNEFKPVQNQSGDRDERTQEQIVADTTGEMFPVTKLKHQLILAQKMKFSITNFFSTCARIRRNLLIWSHLLKKSVMENFHFLCNSIYEELVHWKKNSLRYHQEHQKKVTKMRYLGFLGWKFHH